MQDKYHCADSKDILTYDRGSDEGGHTLGGSNMFQSGREKEVERFFLQFQQADETCKEWAGLMGVIMVV